jgi:hypothetical protein
MFTPFAFVKSAAAAPSPSIPTSSLLGWWDFTSGSYTSGSFTWTNKTGLSGSVTDAKFTGSLSYVTGSGSEIIGFNTIPSDRWFISSSAFSINDSSSVTYVGFYKFSSYTSTEQYMMGTHQLTPPYLGGPTLTKVSGSFDGQPINSALVMVDTAFVVGTSGSIVITGSNDWMMVTSRVSATAPGNQTGSMFINDQLIATGSYFGRPTGKTITKFAVVGNARYADLAQDGLSGSAGPVLVYDRALTTDEINDIYSYYKSTYNLP